MTKTLLISNQHKDYTGGGSYVMMVLNILKKHYRIVTFDHTPYYVNPQTPFALAADEIELANSSMDFDLHLYADYRGWTQPLGNTNIQLIYYPIEKNVTGWNNFFCLNQFCLTQTQNLYQGKSSIISPYFNQNKFYILPKKNQVINVGQYFYEQDGHSKNQHLVIEWFKNQTKFETLILHGKIVSDNYYSYLKTLTQDDPRIILKGNKSSDEIKLDLAESLIMVHAIGYGRTDPAQTEHFGLVAVEALLSGCQPYVHDSGGCKDLDGVMVYQTFSEISTPNLSPLELRKKASVYNIDNTESQLLQAINE